MGGPGVPLVLLQAVELPHVLRVAHRLKDPHVLSAGEHMGPLHLGVHPGDAAADILPLVQLALLQLVGQGRHKIPPDQGRVGHSWMGPGGDFGQVHNVKMALQKPLARLLCTAVLIEQVEGIELLVLGIDPISCEAASQAVGPVMHHRDGPDQLFSADGSARPVDGAYNRAAGGNPHLALFLHKHAPPQFSKRVARTLCNKF